MQVRKKQEIYKELPQLSEIDKKIRMIGIQTAKLIISNDNKDELLQDLNSKIKYLKTLKINLLASKGYTLEDLEPKYECTTCNDTGYIQDKNKITVMCNCLKQELLKTAFENSNLSNLDKENFDNFDETLYCPEPNQEKYKNAQSPRDNILFIKKKALAFIENFDNPEQKNLLFSGTARLGKTFISSCIANELLKKNKTVLYQSAPILFDAIINEKINKDTTKKINQLSLDVDLLIIDDLGVENITSMQLTECLNLLNVRLLSSPNNPKKTIISTNLSINNLRNIYGERFSSRIIGNYDIYNFFGDDLRLILKRKGK